MRRIYADYIYTGISAEPIQNGYVENDDAYYKYQNGWNPWIIGEGNSDAITEEEVRELIDIFKNDTN